ncbi:MAG: ATP-binding protein [Verrucomicrobiota bacterium]
MTEVQDAESRDLQRQREAVNRGLLRVNTAAAIIVAVVLCLAAAAVFQGYHASRNAAESSAAKRRTEGELWKSFLAQARASRYSGQVGRKFESLRALAAAAKIGQSAALRDEAIACLALTDLRDSGQWFPFSPDNQSVAMPPDLNGVAVGLKNGEIHFHQLENGAEAARLSGPVSPGQWLRFSPSGRFLAAHFVGDEVRIWEWRTGGLVLRLENVTAGWAGAVMDFNPDESLLIACTRDGEITLYHLATGGVARQLRLSFVPFGVRFAPTGTRFAITHGGVQVWDFDSGKILAALPFAGEVGPVSWHPNGERLAGGARDGSVLVWDVASDVVRRVLSGHFGVVFAVMFNRRGDLLASVSWDGTTRVWDAGSGRLQFSTRSGYALQFGPGDRQLGYFREKLGAGLWEFSESDVFERLSAGVGGSRDVRSLDLTGDGRFLLSSHSDGIRLWTIPEGEPVAFQSLGRVWSAVLHEGRQSVFVAQSDGIRELSVRTNATAPGLAPRFESPGTVLKNGLGATARMRISPDQHWLAAACHESGFLFDLANPAHNVPLGGNDNITEIAWSPDGRWVATGTWQGSGVRLWNPETGEPIRHLDPHDAQVQFSPDGRQLVTGSGQEYTFWQTSSWDASFRIARDRANAATGAAVFAPDGKLVALTPDSGEISLVTPGDGREVARLTAPETCDFHAFAFSRDGARLFAATESEVIQMWNLATLRERLAALGIAWEQSAVTNWPDVLASAPGAAGGPRRFILLTATGVLLAVFFAAFVLQRHRSLVASYAQIEQINLRRNRQLEMAQAEILHSQKMQALGTLAAGIAHDFNNFLSVIRMSNKLIGRAAKADAGIQESVGEIELAVQQGKGIIRSMLGYSRAGTEESGPFSVPEMVEDSVALLSNEFLAGLALTLELDRNTPPVAVSRGRLEQVLLNLLINAAEAMKGNGELRLSVRVLAQAPEAPVLRPKPSACFVELAIADSGPGINPQILPRIFEPFFSTRIKGQQRGTGLGLSMVYTIAEQDGLGLSVETELGKGTTFRIAVPAGEGITQT